MLNYLNSKNKVLFLFAFLLIAFFCVLAVLSYQDQKNKLEDIKSIFSKNINNSYSKNIEKFEKFYHRRALANINSQGVIEAFKNRDREKLFELSKGRWETLKNENKHLTVMHFHLPDGTSFLRMHEPNKYGDNLSTLRAMVNIVHKNQKVIAGFEVGVNNNLAYRIFVPIFDKNIYIGALEFGFTPDYILNEMFYYNNIEGAFFVKTKLSKPNANQNLTTKDYTLQYDTVNNHNLLEAINKSDISFGDSDQIDFENKIYNIYNFDIKDIQNNIVAKALFFEDITKIELDYEKALQKLLIWFLSLFVGLMAIVYVITKKLEKANNELENSEIKFHTIFEESLDGIVLIDVNTQKFVEYNSSAYNMLDYSKDEYKLLTISDVEAIENDEEIKARQQSILTYGYANFFTKHKTKNMEIKDVYVNTKMMIINDTPYIYASFHDVTDVIKTQDLLKAQKKELETIFNNTKDGIAILDLESNFLEFNDAYQEITGFTKEELLTKSCLGLTVEEDKQKTIDAFKIVGIHGHLENFEKSCIVNNNKRISTNMSISLMPDKQRVLLFTKDITKNKQFEEQARLASMGEMIGNIAHQWRQPLSVISVIASSLKMKEEFGELAEYSLKSDMDEIVSQAKYLSKTIDDFRNYIKNNHDKKEISINEIINKTISIISHSLKNNHIQLVTQLDADIVIYGFENELIQAFINIINNAKDAIKSNIDDNDMDKYIFIETLETTDGLAVNIKDNGGGIPTDVINKIFEPYFTTKHQSVGTGIGLSMARVIISEHHKAKVEVFNSTYSYNDKKYTGANFKIVFF